jgi:TolB-like protein/Tfp pilus assembly protein PilF/DNA-binding winged helix-turn-helix (wHTH) protein
VDLKGHDKFWLRGFEVDPATHTISGSGTARVVRASTMEVLCLLATHPRKFFDNDSLLRSVFPASGERHGLLSACIDELKECLGDDGPGPAFIEHDGERGYRLLEVPQTHGSGDPADEIGDWFDELKRRRVFRAVAAYGVAAWLLLQIIDVLSEALPVPDWTLTAATVALAVGFPVSALLAWIFQITPAGVITEADLGGLKLDRTRLIHYFDLVVIGVLLVAVVFLSYGHVFSSLEQGEEVRIAVLPFENLSEETGDAYLSEGIADDIRSRLYELPQVLVAARSSSKSLSRQGFDIGTIGDRLGVQHILEGTFRRIGDRIRLSVQLVNVETGFNSWTETYDARVEDVLAVQNRISLIVASELRVVLSSEVRELLAENVTDDPEAYEIYLQARNFLDRPRTDANLVSAATLFKQAIARDAGFAAAYAGLCETLITRFADSRDAAQVQPAERNCIKALSLDSRLAEVHSALGGLYTIRGDLGAAEKAYSAAIGIDPRAVDARSALADVYASQGRLDEAEAQFILAIELLPANWHGYSTYGRFLIDQQRYDEAISNYERAIELAPANANGYNNLGVVYYYLGDFQKAAENYRRSLEIDPDGAPYSNIGTFYYFAGDFESAEEMFMSAAEETPTDYRIWGNLADTQRFTKPNTRSAEESYSRAVTLANLQLEVNPNDAETLVNLAWYYANLGGPVAARNALEAARPKAITDAGQLYMIALVHSLLGDPAIAKQYLDLAASKGFPQAMIEATPEFSSSLVNN